MTPFGGTTSFSPPPINRGLLDQRQPALSDGAPALGLPTILVMLIAGAVIGWIALAGSIPVAGVIYAIAFLALTVIRTDLAFLCVFAQAPLLWDLGGGPVRMAIADISLVLATPILLLRLLSSGRPISINPLRWPIVIYLVVCSLSTLANGAIVESLTSMFQMALYLILVVFIYANCIEQPQAIVNALYGLLFIDVILSMVMLVLRSNYVIGLHKNAVGAELDYAVIIAVEFWLFRTTRREGKKLISVVLLILVAALFFSLSRGAWLGTIVGILILLALHKQFKLAIRVALVLIPVVAIGWLLLPQQSADYAINFSSSAKNIQARYDSVWFALELFRQNPVFGMGVGLRKIYDATNIIMSTLAETGILGLLAFFSIFVAMFRMVWKTCRATDPKSPVFALAAIGGALMAAKFAHGCVDHYWSRVMLPVWAMAGTTVWCFNASQQSQAPARAVQNRGPIPGRFN